MNLGLLTLALMLFSWFIKWLVARFLNGIDQMLTSHNARLLRLEQGEAHREQKWSGEIRKAERRIEDNMAVLVKEHKIERDTFRAASAQEHEQTRKIWHDDLQKINVLVGTLATRQERVEGDVEKTTAELNTVAREQRESVDALKESVNELKVTVAGLPGALQRMLIDTLKER